MGDERLAQDLFLCNEQLAVVEKYEDFLNQVYPVGKNISREHSVFREMFLHAVIDQVRLFTEAGKSSQISKLYSADAGLALLRFHLRFMVDSRRRLIGKDKYRVVSILLAEVGKMLGAWLKKTSGARKG